MTQSISELVLENEKVRLTLLPEVGCKITKLEFLRHDFQWLWQDPYRPVKKPEFCANYAAYDISGFDECFPNIGLSKYPPDDQITLCDHGEVWAKPWKVVTAIDSVVASVDLTAMPITFRRKIQLDGERIHFNYDVTNTGNIAYWYMWSAHPLFRLPNRYRVIAPLGQKMYKEFGLGGRLGADGEDGYFNHLGELNWPEVISHNGEVADLSQVIPDLGVTDKVVLEAKGIEDLMLINEDLSAGLSFKFSAEINHVGICSNLTAWPSGPHPATWIAIEPMIGISDRLDENIELGAARKIDPNESQSWNFSITLLDLDIN